LKATVWLRVERRRDTDERKKFMLPEKNIAGIITSESMGWKSGSQHSLLLH
jgi:hypothetical protein